MKKFLRPKNLKTMPKTAVLLPQKADFLDNRGFLFRFELIKKNKNKKTDRHFFKLNCAEGYNFGCTSYFRGEDGAW